MRTDGFEDQTGDASAVHETRSYVGRAAAVVGALKVKDILCLALLGAGLVAWAAGISNALFDYDELEHARAIWLIQTGLRPFRDFFECHPPYLWYPLALLTRPFGETYRVLFVLRILAAVGHILFFVALAKNVSLSFRQLPTPRKPTLSGFALPLALVAGAPDTIRYLLEFRIDAWPNALLIWAIYRYRRRKHDAGDTGRDALARAVELGILGTLAVLCSPKLALILPLFTLADLLVGQRRGKMIAGLGVGGIVALTTGALLIVLLGHNPARIYQMIMTYHSILNREGGFPGIWAGLRSQPTLLVVIAASVIAFLTVVRRRVMAFPFEMTVVVFLVLQVGLVAFWYKQYTAPWFLMGMALIPWLNVLLERVPPARTVVMTAALIYAGLGVGQAMAQFWSNEEAKTQLRAFQVMESMVPRDAIVAAPLEWMPLFRRGPFYHQVTSFAPSGWETGRIMKRIEPNSDRFEVAGYVRELQARPPKLIVLDGTWSAEQKQALDTFVASAAGAYQSMNILGVPALIRN